MKVFSRCFSMMILILGIWVEVGTAQDPITITATQMPDDNLRDLVLTQLKALSIVDSTATTFTDTDMADSDFTAFEDPSSSTKITNLTGLGYATNLTRLSLSDNTISDISDLSKLTKLTYVSLGRNKISDIPDLSSLTALTELWLSPNSITDISGLSGLTNLTFLHLNENKISNISALSGLTSLTQLAVGRNEISNISVLSGLTSLTRLELNENEISNISVLSGLTNLTQLNLHSNSISDISVLSGLTKLVNLTLGNDEIRDFSVLSKLTKLVNLTLAGSKIRTTDVLLPLTKLVNLWIWGHRITDIGEFLKLSGLLPAAGSLRNLYLDDIGTPATLPLDPDQLRRFLWTGQPDSIDAGRAVSFEDYPENLPTGTFSFTIRFDEPVYGFQMDDIIVETKLDIGTGTATLEALTPTTEPAQTYIATIGLPPRAAGTVTLIVRAGAAETADGRIDPVVDRVFGPIAFSTLLPPKRKIVYECPVGWVRSDGFAGRTRRVLLYEVKLEMDLHNRVSIYKPVWVAIYVHPDEGLENLQGWKLQVALPYNHHSEYLLTAENSVVVDSEIEGVEGGFAFIKNPEAAPFPMVGMEFTGATVPGFDYRLYDDTGRKIDFGIACYKRGDIFQVLKNMEEPSVFRNIPLETFNWDADYIRSEWTVPVPVNVPGAPSLQGTNLVGKWADLKKQ